MEIQTSSHGKCCHFLKNFSIYRNFIETFSCLCIDEFFSLLSFRYREEGTIDESSVENHVLGWLTKWSTVFVGLSFFVLQKVVPVTRPVFEVVPMFLLVWVNTQYARLVRFKSIDFERIHFSRIILNEDGYFGNKISDSFEFFPSNRSKILQLPF